MMMNARKLMVGLCVSLVITILSSCDTGPDVPSDFTRWNEEVAQIDADLASQGIQAIKDPSGIRIILSKLGTKLQGQPWNNVDVDYVGRRYVDKVGFDQGRVTGKLSTYINGWQIALSKIPAGSEGKIIIPSIHGYGPTGSGASIPPNTILEFDIKFNAASFTTSDEQRFKSDTTAIETYLQSKGITTAVKDTTGIRYVINTTGIGPTPTLFDRLKLKYNIKLLTDDTKPIGTDPIERVPNNDFYSRPIDYILGMNIGLQKLNIGAKATFYIPSGYAFGPDGVNDTQGNLIPSNANIIVEVELQNIEGF